VCVCDLCGSGAAPALLTSKVGAVGQLGLLVALRQHADDTVLYEVHLLADGALPDDVIPGLEHLKPQPGEHGGDEVGVGVGEQRHGRHQLPTVEVHDFLRERTEKPVGKNGKKRWSALGKTSTSYDLQRIKTQQTFVFVFMSSSRFYSCWDSGHKIKELNRGEC